LELSAVIFLTRGHYKTLSKVPNLEIVTYADDILLIIHGPSHEAVITSVEESLNTIEEWCSKHKLELSKDKTAIMPMFVRKRETYNSHPVVNTRGIKVVTEMKYLGVMLDSRIDWHPHTLSRKEDTAHP